MKPLPVADLTNCWNRIGVWGDRSCPELAKVVHCNNCPVASAAGRRFLDMPSPAGYLEEWTARLAELEEQEARDLLSVLIFRLGNEWLALPVQVLVEVTTLRPVHRIPFRSGLLAGLVNVRGELHLSVRLDRLLGVAAEGNGSPAESGTAKQCPGNAPRLLVVRRGGEVLVFPVDEADRVYRLPVSDLAAVPPTLARASARYTRGVFRCADRAVGYLDDERLFEALRSRLR
jgi:chemotaxis-related protein WspD